jgi:peptidyl-prolyl cis-trans isomerase B (cyclophilin B)
MLLCLSYKAGRGNLIYRLCGNKVCHANAKFLCIILCVLVSAFAGCRSGSKSAGGQWEINAEEAIRRELIDPNQTWKLNLSEPEPMRADPGKEYIWRLETNKGMIKIKLWPDIAPIHVTNTVFLTNSEFYNDLIMSKMIPGLMVRGGGPLKNGLGGPGYRYKSKIKENVKHDRPYLVGSIDRGDNTYGSEFYITLRPAPKLNTKYPIFGEVIEGQRTVDAMEAMDTTDGSFNEIVKILNASIEFVFVDPCSALSIEAILKPENVTATNTDIDKVLIKWEPSIKATEYRIGRSKEVGKVEEASEWQNGTLYADPNAIPGIQYYYRVQARDGESVSPWSSPVAGHRPIPKGLPFEVY